MRSILVLSLIALSFSFNLRAAKQEYDCYVVAVQWSQGMCKAQDCGGLDDVVEPNTLTIHGIWPSLKSGKRLKDCTSGVEVIDDGSELFTKMKKYWLTLMPKNTNKWFWEHEYNKHGYCMVEEYGWTDGVHDYFEFSIDNIFLPTYKDLLKNAFPGETGTVSVSYKEMQSAIREVIPEAQFQMKCGSGYLKEFYFYVAKETFEPTEATFSNQCKTAKVPFQ